MPFQLAKFYDRQQRSLSLWQDSPPAQYWKPLDWMIFIVAHYIPYIHWDSLLSCVTLPSPLHWFVVQLGSSPPITHDSLQVACSFLSLHLPYTSHMSPTYNLIIISSEMGHKNSLPYVYSNRLEISFFKALGEGVIECCPKGYSLMMKDRKQGIRDSTLDPRTLVTAEARNLVISCGWRWLRAW